MPHHLILLLGITKHLLSYINMPKGCMLGRGKYAESLLKLVSYSFPHVTNRFPVLCWISFTCHLLCNLHETWHPFTLHCLNVPLHSSCTSVASLCFHCKVESLFSRSLPSIFLCDHSIFLSLAFVFEYFLFSISLVMFNDMFTRFSFPSAWTKLASAFTLVYL
jgi:hypothetical protein